MEIFWRLVKALLHKRLKDDGRADLIYVSLHLAVLLFHSSGNHGLLGHLAGESFIGFMNRPIRKLLFQLNNKRLYLWHNG